MNTFQCPLKTYSNNTFIWKREDFISTCCYEDSHETSTLKYLIRFPYFNILYSQIQWKLSQWKLSYADSSTYGRLHKTPYFSTPLQTLSLLWHSCKRPSPVTDTFFVSRGCPLTRASTVMELLYFSFILMLISPLTNLLTILFLLAQRLVFYTTLTLLLAINSSGLTFCSVFFLLSNIINRTFDLVFHFRFKAFFPRGIADDFLLLLLCAKRKKLSHLWKSWKVDTVCPVCPVHVWSDNHENDFNDPLISKGQSKNILQPPQSISNLNIFSQITVEKFDKSNNPLQILRKLVDPQITFSLSSPFRFNSLTFEIRNATSTASFCCKLKAFLLS